MLSEISTVLHHLYPPTFPPVMPDYPTLPLFNYHLTSIILYILLAVAVFPPTIPIPRFRLSSSLRNPCMEIDCHRYSSTLISCTCPFLYKNTQYQASITYNAFFVTFICFGTLVLEKNFYEADKIINVRELFLFPDHYGKRVFK